MKRGRGLPILAGSIGWNARGGTYAIGMVSPDLQLVWRPRISAVPGSPRNAFSAWSRTSLTQLWIWLGWRPNSSARLEMGSLPLRWRRTISAFWSGVKCRRGWLMECASDRVHTNPTGKAFQFQVRHYTSMQLISDSDQGQRPKAASR